MTRSHAVSTWSIAPILAPVLAVIAAAGFAFAASAQDSGRASDGPRAALEQACVDQGSSASACACLGDFVETRFTPRELEGVALVFSDPLIADDPGAALAALGGAGYTVDEITAVFERIVSLETVARETCAPDAPPAEADAE